MERGKWPDKSKGDILETYGVAKAIEFIRKTGEHISLPLIIELHRIVFDNSKPFAGKLRENGVEVVVRTDMVESSTEERLQLTSGFCFWGSSDGTIKTKIAIRHWC